MSLITLFVLAEIMLMSDCLALGDELSPFAVETQEIPTLCRAVPSNKLSTEELREIMQKTSILASQWCQAAQQLIDKGPEISSGEFEKQRAELLASAELIQKQGVLIENAVQQINSKANDGANVPSVENQ